MFIYQTIINLKKMKSKYSEYFICDIHNIWHFTINLYNVLLLFVQQSWRLNWSAYWGTGLLMTYLHLKTTKQGKTFLLSERSRFQITHQLILIIITNLSVDKINNFYCAFQNIFICFSVLQYLHLLLIIRIRASTYPLL